MLNLLKEFLQKIEELTNLEKYALGKKPIIVKFEIMIFTTDFKVVAVPIPGPTPPVPIPDPQPIPQEEEKKEEIEEEKNENNYLAQCQ